MGRPCLKPALPSLTDNPKVALGIVTTRIGERRKRMGKGEQACVVQCICRRPLYCLHLRRIDADEFRARYASPLKTVNACARTAEDLGNQTSHRHGQAKGFAAVTSQVVSPADGAERTALGFDGGQPNLDARWGPILRQDHSAIGGRQYGLLGPDVLEYGGLQSCPGCNGYLLLRCQGCVVAPNHWLGKRAASDLQPPLQGSHTARSLWPATSLAGQVLTVPVCGPCMMLRLQVMFRPTTSAVNTSLIQSEKVCSRVILTVAPVAPQKIQDVLPTAGQTSSGAARMSTAANCVRPLCLDSSSGLSRHVR